MPANYTERASADHPPGFYGPPEGLVAVNTLQPDDRLAPLDFAPLNARVDAYRLGEPHDLRGPIFLAALALLCSTRWWCSGLPAASPAVRAAARVAARRLVVILAASAGAGRRRRSVAPADRHACQADAAVELP